MVLCSAVNGWVSGVLAAVLLAVPLAMGASEHPVDIEVFTRPGCPHCAEAEHFLAALARERPELRIVRRDVAADRAALDRLRALAHDPRPDRARRSRLRRGR